MDWKEFNMG